MTINLFVKWDDNDNLGNSIVDEQHRGLIATINSLYYFINEGWSLNSLKPTILMLESYVIFHLKTEESILIKQELSEDALQIITDYGQEFTCQLQEIVSDSIQNEEPQRVAKFLARWWLGHKVDFHQKLNQYFSST